jgi:hypothetical protein
MHLNEKLLVTVFGKSVVISGNELPHFLAELCRSLS